MKKNLEKLVRESNNLSLNINVNKDDNELNDYLYCWQVFSSRPNKIVIHNTYQFSLFDEIINKNSTKENQVIEIIPGESQMVINEKALVKISDTIFCSYLILDKNTEHSVVSELSFFYSDTSSLDTIQKLVEDFNSCLLDFSDSSEGGLNTIVNGQNGIELEVISHKYDSDCFDMYYNKKTLKEINKLIKDIKKSDKGLSILYGERGKGKTSVINYIASKLDRTVIFIPNNMVESTINNSDFKKFLKRFDKPILVIDDCEMLLNEFFNKANILSNNLLQMVDGLLSDSINVNILSIFNVEDEEEIDHTLLECNNLNKVVHFEKLSSEEATELSEYLGHNKKIKNKSNLIDIIRNKDTKAEFNIGL